MPELIPGLPRGTNLFTLPECINRIRTDARSDDPDRRTSAITLPLVALLWFLPSWLYRFSLKSTAWFWWPLAYLLRPPTLAQDPAAFHWRIMRSLRGLGSIAMAVATILGFLWVHLALGGALGETNPFLSVAGYLFLIDWSALFPWQALLLGSAVLTIVIVVQLNWAHGTARHAKTQTLLQEANRWTWWVERLVMLRTVLTVFYLVAVGGQILLYFNSQDCGVRIRPNVQAWVNTIYGTKAPNQTHCQWPP